MILGPVMTSWMTVMGFLLVLLPFFVTPAMAETISDTDKILIDTARADYGLAGLHIGGKPSRPAEIRWYEDSFSLVIDGSLFLDSFMVSTGCAQLVLQFLNRDGRRISVPIDISIENVFSRVTTSTWSSPCLSNAGFITNMVVWQKRYYVQSWDARIHTVRFRTKYCCGVGLPANGAWVQSQRYCADHDGVNGSRRC